MKHPPLFARPDGEAIQLGIQPRLASWKATGHPDQVRLKEFLTHAESLVRPRLDGLHDPLALRLDVGLPRAVLLLEQHDLDNYAFPLVTWLGKTTGRRFVSVWATKQHATHSYVRVDDARPVEASLSDPWIGVRTSSAATSTAFKQEISDQLGNVAVLPDGPVSVQLSFVVGAAPQLAESVEADDRRSRSDPRTHGSSAAMASP